MGLFKFIKSQLLEVIEWTSDTQNDLMVYRFPVDDKEIKNGAQLTVRESQVAIFVNEGQIADVFGPGRYKLETANLPILTKINSWKYDFNSPFKAEVYYVNTKQFIGQKWGTSNPFALRDNDFGIVRIRAFGTYSIQVTDAALFLKEVFGTADRYSVKGLTDYVKSIITSAFTDFMAEQKTPVLDIPTLYNEIGDGTAEIVAQKIGPMGLTARAVVVENISLPENVEKAIDERASMGAIGNMNTYTQYKAANAIDDAAKNQGGMAGTGASLGVGLGFGSIMANSMKQSTEATNTETKVICPHCGAQVKENSKFCPECGKAIVVKKVKCSNCNAEIPEGSKFCPECGKPVGPSKCPKCGKEVAPNTKFCPECGEKIG